MDRPGETTHFGFRDVPLGDKQTLVNDVFHSVAQRYDLMNDLMSAGLHRVWKDLMINALNPPRGDTPFALLDVAGGTGDIAFRAAKAAGPGFRATVCDINSDMLEVGRERAAARHLDDRVSFVEGNAEALAFPDRTFDAYTIAFGIRNVPRIDLALSEAFRVLKPGSRFLCLEFSTVDVPGLDRHLRPVFVQGDPAARPRRDRRRRILSIPRRIDPQISQAERVRRDDPRRRLFARQLAKPFGRHRGAAFGLAFVISAITHIARLARAGFVFAREGVFGVVDPTLVPPPGQLALRIARLIERPGAKSGPRLSRALTRLGPGLSQARTVSRHPARRGRRHHGARSGKPAGPAAAVFAERGRSRDRDVAGTPGGAGVCELRSGGRRGLDRAGASRRNRARRRAHAGRGEGAAAQCRRALPPRPRRFLLCRAQGRSPFGGSAAAAADRGHQYDVALGGDGDGSAARGRRAVRDGREHPRRSGFSRADRRLGPHHPQRADHGMDRRHRAQRSRAP